MPYLLLFLGPQVLGLDLTKSAVLSVLPWATMAATANLGGWLADSAVERGASVTTVRKVGGGGCAGCGWVGVCHVVEGVGASVKGGLLHTRDLLSGTKPSPSISPARPNPKHAAQVMQTLGFLGPAFFLTLLSRVDSVPAAVGAVWRLVCIFR